MSREILFTNAAVQNGDFSLDEKPYKAIGIISARVLNHLAGNADMVHAWNDVGMFGDIAATSQLERMAKKYDSHFMRNHLERWSPYADPLQIVSDTDDEFGEWANGLIDKLLQTGDIKVLQEEFTVCGACGIAIAEKAVPVAQCSRCRQTDHLTTESQKAFFIDVVDDRSNLIRDEQVYNTRNIRQERRNLDQIPPRLLVSRDRERGVKLDVHGLDGKVLDPRLGVGLLALYLADQRGYESAGIVQSYTTFIRTVPYINSAISDSDTLGVPSHRFVFHSKIEPHLLEQEEISPELLSFHALRQKVDVTAESMIAISAERSKLIERAKIVRRLANERGVILQNLSAPADSLDLGVAEGDLTYLLSKVSKRLGVAIEASKHHGNTRGELLGSLYEPYATIGPIIQEGTK